MDYLIVASVCAGITAAMFKRKGRSPLAGALLGLVLPVISVFIAFRMKTGVSTFSKEIERDLSTSAKPTHDEVTHNPSTSKTDLSGVLLIPSSGYHGQEVAGESHHFAELKKVTKALGGSGEHEVIALLIPEPSNRYDKNAIRVEVHGLLCGYIPSDQTIGLRPLLDYADKQGKTLGVNARVWSGLADYDENEDERTGDWIASVRLDIGYQFSLAFPLNEPGDSEVAWPAGSTLKAHGTEDHMTEITNVLADAYVPGSCSVFLKLEPTDLGIGKMGVGLFHNDQQLGLLSQTSANKFLPVLLKVPQNRSILALCNIEGNSIAVQISVHLLSPEKLTEDDLRLLGL